MSAEAAPVRVVSTHARLGGAAADPKPHSKPTVRINFKRGTISVRGTKAKDHITVVAHQGSFEVKANGRRTVFKSKSADKSRAVKSIHVSGRSGNDKIKMKVKGGKFPTTVIQGGNGDDRLVGGNGPTSIDGRGGNDRLKAGAGGTKLTGSAGNDVLIGGSAATNMTGGDGDDTLQGGSGVNTMSGQGGNDQLVGGDGKNKMVGGDGNDVLVGGSGASTMHGANGNDTLTGGSGVASLDGGNDDDLITGGTAADTLLGAGGDDRLVGGSAKDTLVGGGGDDALVQSPGGDSLMGSEGADTYFLDADSVGGAVSLVEQPGDGFDTVSLAATTTVPVALDLGTTAVQPLSSGLSVQLNGAKVFENAVGGSLDDTLTGNELSNTFTGGPGRDVFRHHGAGDGVDKVTDMSADQGDQVRFLSDTVRAGALVLNAAGSSLRDAATTSFGYDFATPVLKAGATYVYGTLGATAVTGQLVSDSEGALSYAGSAADNLVTLHSGIAATVSGGSGNDRLVDYTGSSNTLRGGAGADVLTGGAGGDVFQLDGTGTDAVGNDVITDFGAGDTVDIDAGVTVSGLGTPVVTLTNSTAQVVGTATAGNGRNWQLGDFS